MKPFHQAACQTQNFKSHFVSNIIFIQWEWWRQELGGAHTERREGGCRRSGGCYFKDKRIHHSKLEKKKLQVLDDVTIRVCVFLTDKVIARPLGGWADARDLRLKFPSSGALGQQRLEPHLQRLIKRPSKWECLTAAAINNHSQQSD